MASDQILAGGGEVEGNKVQYRGRRCRIRKDLMKLLGVQV